MNIGVYIKNIITEQGRKQEWVAEQAGINKGTLSRIISGHRDPSIKTLDKISKALGVPLVNFLIACGYLKESDEEQLVSESKAEYSLGIPPELTSLIQAIKDNPEKASAVAALIEKMLKEQMDCPGDLSDFAAFILGLPENQRKGILMAFGGVE